MYVLLTVNALAGVCVCPTKVASAGVYFEYGGDKFPLANPPPPVAPSPVTRLMYSI